MSVFKKLVDKFKKTLKFSVSDPSTFSEIWSFNSNRFRVYSLVGVLLLIFAFGVLYLFADSFVGRAGKNDKPIERDKLEKQRESIDLLTAKIDQQDKYIESVRLILNGEVPIDSDLDSLKDHVKIDYSTINSEPSEYEKELAKKVRNDMRTSVDKKSVIPYFKSPAQGVISQKFEMAKHAGIDVVTEKDYTVKSCLAGTIIYSGFTRKDGHILIIDHANEYMSVYKHNKKALKKNGQKVNLGDPIAIVGNTGENTDGPHLHFELWYRQSPVNPEDYMKFTR